MSQPANVIDGERLAAIIPDQGFPLDKALHVAIQLAEAVSAVHAQGRVLHGLSPSDILHAPGTGRVWLGHLERATAPGEPASAADPARLGYISPEQTGRIGRGVDQRSDLYSLGANLFHLLTGKAPFVGTDALALVHAQLARRPPDPRTVKPGLPDVVAEIVLRLLAKQPEERYQTIAGVLADLRECATRLCEAGAIAPFPIGRRDVTAHLRLPERLYGRAAEIAALEAALGRVSGGGLELLRVAGSSGTGKSSLVEQLRRPTEERGGWFLAGKFEQLGEPAPFAPIRQAFAAFIERLATERPGEIERLRPALDAALAQQGGVIIDVIPEAVRLLGEQPPVEALGPIEARHRFTRVFLQLLGVLARPGQPLVLLLDDCQWADPASLRLVEGVLGAEDLSGLLVIAAYRDNEVGPEHPLTGWVQRLQQKSVEMSVVNLSALREGDVAALVADALDRSQEEVAAVAQELHQRVEGNPFYLRAFLSDLCDSRTLSRDAAGHWQWDMARLAATAPPESVLRLVGSRLERLPEATRDLLKVAACLGSTFTRERLAIASGQAAEQVQRALEPALQAGVLVDTEGRLRFLHDRVQEAAHGLIGRGDEAALELAIGRRLREVLERDGDETCLAQAVQHLNAGRGEIREDGERGHLAQLNLRAGAAARRSTAYASAARHAAIGIELLGEAGWRSDYATTFELHALSAECEYLCGRFDAAEALFPRALHHARSDLDRIRILNIRKDQYELQGRYLDALAVLKEGLAVVGVTFPDTPEGLREALRRELAQMPGHLRGRRIAELADAPTIDDPLKAATVRMLVGMWASCYVAGLQDMLGLVSVKVANFSLRHGNCEVTSAAYVNYSFVAGLLDGDYERAFEYGQVGLALAERYSDRSVRAWCHFLIGCGTLIWRRPLHEGLPHLERSVEYGIASGNIACASYAASYIVTDSFMRGMRLDEARQLYARHFPFLERNNPAIHVFGQLGTIALRELCGIENFDERAFLQAFGAAEFFMAVYRFGKLCACYLGDRIEEGATHVEPALELVPRLLAGTFKVPETLFYSALTVARIAERRSGAERDAAVAQVEDLAARLRSLAQSCPHNVAHKARLLEAELARLGARSEDAMQAYEEAARGAAGAGFGQDEALAYELCARYLHARGLGRLAAASMRDAVAAWEAWGAVSRVRLLEREFGAMLPRGPQAHAPATARDVSLDWLSVTKASQAISREIDFDHLVERLVQIVGENAGARRAVLMLPEGEQLVAIAEADLSAEPTVRRPGTPLRDMDLPATIVEDCWRDGTAIVLEDASRHGPYKADPRVVRRGLRSILCMPIRHQAAVRGVLYLENDLGSGVFTDERRELLELLLAQVTISLANARLYAELKQNEERLRGVFDQALAGIAQTDLSGRFVAVNARYAQIVGRKPEELLGMRMQDITDPEDLERNLPLFNAMVQGRSGPFTIEKRYILPGGEETWVNNSVSLVRSPEGAPRNVVAVSVDITDRKRAEATLRLQNERLRLLWQAAGVLLTTDGPDAMLHGLFDGIRESMGLDAYFNYMAGERPGTLRLASCTGIDEEKAGTVRQLDFGQSVSGTVALTRRAFTASNVQDSETPEVQRIRAWGIRAYACYPLLAGERLLGTLSFASRTKDAFARDELEFLETVSQYVTMAYERLRLIEGMREQDRRKDEFLATLSHELRNPLAPIRNGLHILQLASGDASIMETARAMMQRQIEHMVRLVDDLLDMSRISRNKLELRRELVDLATVARTAVETSRPVIDAAGHAFELELPSAPVLLEADPVRLAQVFANLLNNAAKYTPRGGRIRMRAECTRDEAIVSIRDNGSGISPAQLESIFEMFVQLERPLESAAGGLGIGLTLVKRLVQMHGGTVEARSDGPDHGSEFIVRLPLAERRPVAPEASSGPATKAAHRCRILVADDNQDAAESLALMLRMLGHEVFVAHDGAEAVDVAATALPDIVFLDLGMPRMGGHEAAKRIRKGSAENRPLLVALTGWGQEEDRRRSSAAGFDHHLVKPVELSTVETVIGKALVERQARAEGVEAN